MMYTFPNKLRNLAIAFMVIGFLGLAYGFINAPKTIEEAKAMVASSHGEGHGESHDETTTTNLDEEDTHAVSESHDNSLVDGHVSSSHQKIHEIRIQILEPS